MGEAAMTLDPILFEAEGVSLSARLMTRLDRNPVFTTWIRSAREILKETSRMRRVVDWDTFQASYPHFIESLLDSERTVVLFRPEEPGVPHAWACASRHALHWAYVPYAVRGVGIGRTVIEAALGGYPERIAVTSPFLPRSSRFLFNPFALRGRA